MLEQYWNCIYRFHSYDFVGNKNREGFSIIKDNQLLIAYCEVTKRRKNLEIFIASDSFSGRTYLWGLEYWMELGIDSLMTELSFTLPTTLFPYIALNPLRDKREFFKNNRLYLNEKYHKKIILFSAFYKHVILIRDGDIDEIETYERGRKINREFRSGFTAGAIPNVVFSPDFWKPLGELKSIAQAYEMVLSSSDH